MWLPFAEIDSASQTLRQVFTLIVPEAFLLVAACLLYLGGTVRSGRNLWASAAVTSLALSFWLFWTRTPTGTVDVGVTAILPDRLAEVAKCLAYGSGLLLVLLFWDDIAEERAADFFACVLLLVAGLSLVSGANDLLTLFVALELVSIPTYILLYLPRSGSPPQEAAIKYFLLSVFSSALLLFGFSYIYGETGTIHLARMGERIAGQGGSELVIAAVVMAVAGIGFRITAVPFHFYAPDVFQGVPTSLAAMLSIVPKLAGFTALVRLGQAVFWVNPEWAADSQTTLVLWLLAVMTMTVGNVLALWQTNLKRLLAYSSVAHGGYMLIGITAATQLRGEGLRGIDAVFFYLAAYGAMTLGAFAVLHALRSEQREVQTIDDLAGLGRSRPLLALALTLFLFSLIGLPLTAGFSGKLLLFLSALAAEDQVGDAYRGMFTVLAVIGALNAAAAAYYYLRLVGTMYLRDATRPLPAVARRPAAVVVTLCAGLTLALGIYPSTVVSAISRAVAETGVVIAGR